MPKNPDAKNLFEYTGVIELKPNQFERVSPAIREAKSYSALAGTRLAHSLDGKEPASTDFARAVIDHLRENLLIADEQAANLNHEATAALDILNWTISHGGEEASGVIPTGPLTATAWLNRRIQSIEAQKGYNDGSLYITALQQAQMRINLSRESTNTETFRVEQATVFAPRTIQTDIKGYKDDLIAFTIAARGEKGKKFFPRVKHLTHSGPNSEKELAPIEALIEVLPGTEFDILDLDKRASGDTKWKANWLAYLGDRMETEKLTRTEFPVVVPEEKCSVGPITFRDNKNHKSLEIEVHQSGQFPLYQGGLLVSVKTGKKQQRLKIKPTNLAATIFLPGSLFAERSGSSPLEVSKLLDKSLSKYAQALLDMTAVEVVSK